MHTRLSVEEAAAAEEAGHLANALAKAFRGTPKAQVTASGGRIIAYWLLSSRIAEMRCIFFVFPGGFDMWVQNFRTAPIALHVGRRRPNYAVCPELPEALPEPLLAYEIGDERKRHGSIAFCHNQENREDLLSLCLGPDDSVEIVGAQLRMRLYEDRIPVIKERLGVIGRLFRRHAPPPRPPPLTDPYRITLNTGPSGSATGHVFGGVLVPPVLCPVCRLPAHCIAEFAAHDPALSKLDWSFPRFTVVTCLACWMFAQPIYVDYATAQPQILKGDSDISGEGTEPLPLRRLTLLPGSSRARGHRLGGNPGWIQSDETPVCVRCGKLMGFFVQFRSDRHATFGDEGVLYFFLCRPCRVGATVIQSH